LFSISLTAKAQKQLDKKPRWVQQQYHKAFSLLAQYGAQYPSLRTHRYQKHGWNTWGSSASMALRFYWRYVDIDAIEVTGLNSH